MTTTVIVVEKLKSPFFLQTLQFCWGLSLFFLVDKKGVTFLRTPKKMFLYTSFTTLLLDCSFRV